MSSVTSNSSGESCEEFSRKRTLIASNLSTEEIEPYVRHKRANISSEERGKKRAENLSEEEQNLLRTCINSRERRRMHDLNDALDDLRRVIPHTNNMRKLSKISTIMLATNRIQELDNTMDQLRTENNKFRQQLGLPALPIMRQSPTSSVLSDTDRESMPKSRRKELSVGRMETQTVLPAIKKVMMEEANPVPTQSQLAPGTVAFLPPIVAATLQSMVAMNARNVLQQQHLMQERQFSANGLAEAAALRLAYALRMANAQKQHVANNLRSNSKLINTPNDNNNNDNYNAEKIEGINGKVCEKCHLFPTATSDSSTSTSSCLCVSCILSGREALTARRQNSTADLTTSQLPRTPRATAYDPHYDDKGILQDIGK